jgi:hypothetical protein
MAKNILRFLRQRQYKYFSRRRNIDLNIGLWTLIYFLCLGENVDLPSLSIRFN